MLKLLLFLAKLVVAGTAVLAVALVAGCAGERALVYFPSRSVPDPAGMGLADVEVARFTADDGVALCGWFAPATAPGRSLAVLVCHGNGGNVADRAHLLQDLPALGLSVLVLDWRGYGNSDDVQPTEEGLYRDGRAALAWLAERTGLPPSRIVLYGESLGSGIAVQLALEAAEAADTADTADTNGASGPTDAARAPAAPYALVLQAPFTSLPDAASFHYPWLPVSWLLRDRYDSASKIGRVRVPLLVIHGSRDGTVPVEQGRALAAAAGGTHRFIELPGRGHNDLWRDRAARRAELAAFLDELR
jgi:uncharacterized protein